MYMSPPQLFSRANAMRSLFVHSTSRHLATSSTSSSTPVLISGAGPVGLTLSLLLARQGVPSTVIERRPYLCGEEDQANLRPSNPSEPSSPPLPPSHPRAHVLNARTMEIFRSMGLEKKVRALAPPDHQWDNFRYCQSLIGDDYAVDRHTLKGNERYENLIKHTPSFITHVSQPKLESLLLEEVRAVGSDMIDLHTNTQVIDFIESEESSSGRVRSTDIVLRKNDDEDDDRKKRETNKMNCFYFVGCDGAGSLVRDKLNIPLHGDRALERFASVHFTSPHLASLMGGSTRSSMLYFVMNPKIISCVVGHDLKEGSFVAQVPVFPPFSASTGDESSSDWQLWCENAVDACIGTSGLERTIHSSRVWSMDSLCAARFHNEKNINIFLVGDSAHQLPPSGGFGLNTGIQDAHNLSWKMACAYKEGGEGRRWRNGDDNDVHHDVGGLRGEVEVEEEEEEVSKSETKMKGLLQTYTSERKPVALANMRVSNDNYKRGLEAPASIGLNRDLIAVASSALDNSSSPVVSFFFFFSFFPPGYVFGALFFFLSSFFFLLFFPLQLFVFVVCVRALELPGLSSSVVHTSWYARHGCNAGSFASLGCTNRSVCN